MKKSCIIFVVISLLISCIKTEKKVNQEEYLINIENGACNVFFDSLLDENYILENSEFLMKETFPKYYDCIYILMDSLSNMFINTSKEKYLIALDSLSQFCDGILAENMSTVIVSIYQKNMYNLMIYLFNNNSNLITYLHNGLSLEIALYEEEKWNKIKESMKDSSIKIMQLNSNDSCDIEKLKSFIESLTPEDYR